MFISYWPPVPGNLGVFVVDFRKRVAEKVGMAQNFARETQNVQAKNEGLV